ncbi:hypothetical protein K9M41_01390 [Candidatus Gracilibacteria bacterium]|nr:hypothetical protein [Candidatus Gracilibacteria bacterium]
MEKVFKELGLNKKEINTFLRLLELGAQPVSVIARNVGLPRPSMYLVLEELKKIGLVEEFQRSGMKYVKCIPAKNLPGVLIAQEQKIQQTRELLEKNLPELEELENKLSITPKVKFFEGEEAVKKMYAEVLEEREFKSFFNPQLMKEMMSEYFYTIPEELKRNRGSAQELLVDCVEAQEYKKKYESSEHEIKILKKGIEFPSDTIISKDKIFMISYGENQISATEIWNASLAETQRVLFHELWKTL